MGNPLCPGPAVETQDFAWFLFAMMLLPEKRKDQPCNFSWATPLESDSCVGFTQEFPTRGFQFDQKASLVGVFGEAV